MPNEVARSRAARAAAGKVLEKFGAELDGAPATALRELAANFADQAAQGTRAYVRQMLADHPESDSSTVAADAILAVGTFCTLLLDR